MQQANHGQIYPFICKVKRAVKTRMAQNKRAAYLALIILQDYTKIDNYGYDFTRVDCRIVDQKRMPFQVECTLVLSNGDIAISGGPFRFEVLIYRHDLELDGLGVTGRQREKLKQVDSIDTDGLQVVQMLELNDQYLLVVGNLCQMRLYLRPAKTTFEETKGTRPAPS